jgi:two-component system NtrC family sensor kinase
MADPSRILVVEDSETQSLRLRLLLEEQGWETTGVATAEAALTELAGGGYDLVIVDYNLPGMRGDELCRQIRMKVDTRAVPILMLTVEEGQAAELLGLDSGADDYVSKLAEIDLLLLRVRALLRKAQTQAAILGGGEGRLRRARLLVIDDSPTYLERLAGELTGEGYEVVLAESGEAGLALLRREPIDGVLVDLAMPGMDGMEVCRHITELRRTMDNPVVVLMLTAHETREDMTRGLEAGADDFVGKSSDMAVLKARIRALLRRKFFQEENQRIVQELKTKELETMRARAEKEVAETRAAMVDQLEEANRRLKETQAQLVQSAKMASLGQLVAGIAHEVNNPLSFALSNLFTTGQGLDKLDAELEPHLSATARRRLEKIRARLADSQEGLERVRDLVTHLRTFSRLDEGEFKTVDVQECVEAVLRVLHHRLEDRIEVRVSYGPVATLTCFPGPFNQVLMNLIANAIDAIDGPGQIDLTTGEEAGDFVFTVRDNGRGIPQAIGERLFEPFFTTKPVGEGTGLGLAITYGIVRAHWGTVDFESHEGEGTTFIVRIPLDLEERATHERTREPSAADR